MDEQVKMDGQLRERIERLAAGTPDPARAARGMADLLGAHPGREDLLMVLPEAARLFASCRYLAPSCIEDPSELVAAVRDLRLPVAREAIEREMPDSDRGEDALMRALRLLKRRWMLRITLRYLTRHADVVTSMEELSVLAEVLIEGALRGALGLVRARYGSPPGEEKIAVVAFGKLGGMELNYSSDVDLMAVHGGRSGQTAGMRLPSGVRTSRISAHEFYCKVVEGMTHLLAAQTAEGVAYRVDMRLRPQGQRGDLALDLKSYRDYYGSWARTWERMALIRARPVAGDRALGQAFMDMAREHLWRSTPDLSEIDEIRALKRKIDSVALRDDIKRGYGGIREAEFFVQTFQLLYGGGNPALRSYRVFNAIQALRRMGIVPEGELASLWEGYIFLRQVEHYLQMREDLQTYAVPPDEAEREVLARDIGFPSAPAFAAELHGKRMGIRSMYNSLLGTAEDVQAEAVGLLEGDLGDLELEGYLSFRQAGDTQAALRSLRSLSRIFREPRPLGERPLVRRVLPLMVEDALHSASPERALAGLDSFFEALGTREAYLRALDERRPLREGIVRLFALAPELGRALVGDAEYLNRLIEDMPIRKSLCKMRADLRRTLARDPDFQRGAALFRGSEELRLAIFLLTEVMPAREFMRNLSHVADAVVAEALVRSFGADARGVLVVGMGKLGGREITFGSDLDLMFVAEGEGRTEEAEGMIRLITGYSEKGAPYSVDMRLRPDGTKGMLLRDIAGFREYYAGGAAPWEIQALVRARPIAGDPALARAFMAMAREAVRARGGEMKRRDIEEMRERIVRQHVREDGGMDIKLGPGGIGDIEFYIQWQLLRAASAGRTGVLVQNTEAALGRLARARRMGRARAGALRDAYRYYRRLETFLRMGGAGALPTAGPVAELAARFMGHPSLDDFLTHMGKLRETTVGHLRK